MRSTITIKMFLLTVSVGLLSGCAMYDNSEEALQRADRALEQAELANQRVDRLVEGYGGK